MQTSFSPEVLPFDDDKAAIAEMLQEASIPALLMSMAHMAGAERVLNGTARPQGAMLNEIQGMMSEEDKDRVKEEALKIILEYRDRGFQLAPAPDEETVHKLMNFMMGQEVPEDYVPMMNEEMQLSGINERYVDFSHIPQEKRRDFHVLVVGAGMSGILAGILLKEAGISFTIVEKNSEVGGTWHENQYPGCRVDVGSHFYCYSFEPREWSELFPQQPEIQRYFRDCFDKYGLAEHSHFETEVASAVYQEEDGRWRVSLRTADGQVQEQTFNALISCVGQLNRPKLPAISGIDKFSGPAFHSAQWDHNVNLSGKRVAVVGVGASAFQLIPSIADQVASCHVFQRSAPWMFPNPDYHRKISKGMSWCFKYLPYYARWHRFQLFWPATDGVLPTLKRDSSWAHQERSVSEGNEFTRDFFFGWIKDQIGDDPELLEKVTPVYPPLGKRTLQDNGLWLSTLKRDHIELITDPIVEITERGIVFGDGAERQEEPFDVIVYATGFHANRFLWPMELTGRGGIQLSEQWGDDPEAYLGITTPNFPNLFCCYGPATNLAASGSLIFHSECQLRYILTCIKALFEEGKKSLECCEDVCAAYNRKLQSEHKELVWTHPSIESSWYQNANGKVTVLSPWRLLDYWQWTRAVKKDEFIFYP